MGKKLVKSVGALLSPVGYWVRKNGKVSSDPSSTVLENVKAGAHLLILRLNQASNLPPFNLLSTDLEVVMGDPLPNGCGGPIRRERVRPDRVLGYGRRVGGGRGGGAGGGGGGGGGQQITCNLCRLGCRYRYCPWKRAGRRCGAQCRCIENSYLNHCFNRV